MDREDAMALVRTLCNRHDFLVALRAGPCEKRSLVDDLDVSRSTVDRALRELWSAGLAEETDRGYRLTAVGRLAASIADSLFAATRDLQTATDVLSPLPPDAPLDLRLLRGATVDDRNRRDSLGAVESVLRDASRLYGLSTVISRARIVDLVDDAVRERGATAEFVFDATLAERLREILGDRASAMVDRGFRPLTVDSVPFGMVLGRTDEGWKTRVVTYDDGGDLRGVVSNDRPAAAAWAWDVFRSYRSHAADISPAF
ncbi:helix-turn-helix transcriptional regulator [Halostella salina]|uniref:helix-turn-helix transcriptional regulator n=1 Tax=Halostella salina TaxID=1547897 RepID=UPI000EF7AEAB|nr:hypothetical protein [Halostella salina]